MLTEQALMIKEMSEELNALKVKLLLHQLIFVNPKMEKRYSQY